MGHPDIARRADDPPVILRLEEFSEAGRKIHVLGNGPSRQGFKRPSPWDRVVGCNAAYRDTEIDWLCAMDFTMIREILHAPYDWGGRLVLREENLEKVLSRMGTATQAGKKPPPWIVRMAPPASGLWTTGTMAIYVACKLGSTDVVLHGFDGGDENLYRGSDLYPETKRAPRWRQVLSAFTRIQQAFPDVKFSAPKGSYLLDGLPDP